MIEIGGFFSRRIANVPARVFGAGRNLNLLKAESANVTVMFGLALPVLIGGVGLAIDIGEWELAHKSMQRAADSAAISGAVALFSDGSGIVPEEAKAIAADYKFVDGVAGAQVVANTPPTSGAYLNNVRAVEVIVTQPQKRIFSAIFGGQAVPVKARAVALENANTCVLALDQSAAAAISAQGSTNVGAHGCSVYSDSNSSTSVNVGGTASMSALMVGAVGGVTGQSNITTTNGIDHGGILPDPYANVPLPSFSGCDQTNFSAKNTMTISPGVYCGGLKLNAGANVTMSPGIYFVTNYPNGQAGSLTVNGAATLTGTGVTIVFTSSTPSSQNSFGNATIAGGATVNLTAPSSGPMQGIVMYGDRRMTAGIQDSNFSLAGGTSQAFNGAVYLPKAAVAYAGGASSFNGCSQVIADTISFSGGSNLAMNCSSLGVRQIGAAALLVE
jgi:hypothetical protein